MREEVMLRVACVPVGTLTGALPGRPKMKGHLFLIGRRT